MQTDAGLRRVKSSQVLHQKTAANVFFKIKFMNTLLSSPLDGAPSPTRGLEKSSFPQGCRREFSRSSVCAFDCVAAVLSADLRLRVLAWRNTTAACSRSLRAPLCVTCCQTDSRAVKSTDSLLSRMHQGCSFLCVCVHVGVRAL